MLFHFCGRKSGSADKLYLHRMISCPSAFCNALTFGRESDVITASCKSMHLRPAVHLLVRPSTYPTGSHGQARFAGQKS